MNIEKRSGLVQLHLTNCFGRTARDLLQFQHSLGRPLVSFKVMKFNKQIICSNVNGDCFRACLTAILDMENSNKLPNTGEKMGYSQWLKILRQIGLTIRFEPKACWSDGYWIASVPSKNFAKSTHAIVMNGTKVALDPSLKKRYRVGSDLLGKSIVNGGYHLEVIDFAKLNNRAMRRRTKK